VFKRKVRQTAGVQVAEPLAASPNEETALELARRLGDDVWERFIREEDEAAQRAGWPACGGSSR
jgi:hypothetical protein